MSALWLTTAAPYCLLLATAYCLLSVAGLSFCPQDLLTVGDDDPRFESNVEDRTRMQVGGTRMKVGGTLMQVGGTSMQVGGTRMQVGGTRMQVGGGQLSLLLVVVVVGGGCTVM